MLFLIIFNYWIYQKMIKNDVPNIRKIFLDTILKSDFETRMMTNENTGERVKLAVVRPYFPVFITDYGLCHSCGYSVILETRKNLQLIIERTICKCSVRVVVSVRPDN
jgi:hypothetical protein